LKIGLYVIFSCTTCIASNITNYTPQDLEHLPDYGKVQFPNMPAVDLQMLMPEAHPRAIELLKAMLSLNPNRRPTALQVCLMQ
jgi:cell cycle related kinase